MRASKDGVNSRWPVAGGIGGSGVGTGSGVSVSSARTAAPANGDARGGVAEERLPRVQLERADGRHEPELAGARGDRVHRVHEHHDVTARRREAEGQLLDAHVVKAQIARLAAEQRLVKPAAASEVRRNG